MTAVALNQTGIQSLTVGGVQVAVTLPTYKDYTDAPLGITRSQTPRHALIQVYDQPVRWLADSNDPSGIFGQLILPGGEINWLDPRRDYYGVISRLKFITDTTATGDAHVEVAFFA